MNVSQATAERASARHTVSITGRGAPPVPRPHRPAPDPRGRPRRTLAERTIARPDRVALWAVLMGLAMAASALATGNPG